MCQQAENEGTQPCFGLEPAEFFFRFLVHC